MRLAREAINDPRPPASTASVNALKSLVKPDNKRAAGTLLII